MRSSLADYGYKAPFPYFGGKSRVAELVWSRLGNCPNYVEPFFGSGAVLLARPHTPATETVNDIDGLLCNFWRAVAADPEAVAMHADYPVSELDIISRHRWLIGSDEVQELLAAMKNDPCHYNAKVAGWWVWGACAWIGAWWCKGTKEQLPHVGDAGMGINRKLPHVGDAGMGTRYQEILAYFTAISERLRAVRICCGEWDRVLGDSCTIRHGITGVFLDPPYSAERSATYSYDSFDVSHAVREWAIANGDNPLYRIALCGYDGEHTFPDTWDCISWKASRGYGSQGDERGRENCARERIWFSPHCLNPQGTLFEIEEASK